MKPKRLKDCLTQAEEIRWRKAKFRFLNRSFRCLSSDYENLYAKFCGLEAEFKSLQLKQYMKEATPALLRDKLAVMRWHYKDAMKALRKRGIALAHDIPEEILFDDTNRDRKRPRNSANAGKTLH